MNMPAAPAWAKAKLAPDLEWYFFFHFSNQLASCHPLNQSEIALGRKTVRIFPQNILTASLPGHLSNPPQGPRFLYSVAGPIPQETIDSA